MLVKPITRVKDKLWELCSPGRSRPRLWQSHLPGFVPAAVASLGRNHLSLSMASRPATSAAKAGMMEEAIAREGGEEPSILAPFPPSSSIFIHSENLFVCYCRCRNLKGGRENSDDANQQMPSRTELGRLQRLVILSHDSLGLKDSVQLI